jgi:steroid 5-alpha reductase family enzyme
MSALEVGLYGCAAVAFACWLLSVITREYSWVDRLWSITPPLYVGYFAYETGFSDARLLLMLVLSALWGARLSFNFARKGGYAKGGEDYRWAVLRERMPPWLYQVFNFTFIAGIQNFLLFALTLPAWVAYEHRTPLQALDLLLACAFLALLTGETVADNQQWRFQQEKSALRARGEAIEQPFITRGLFSISRHPNFFCEQAQWWVFYGFSVVASGRWLNLSILGAVGLSLLFHGSANFTEQLSLAKYPAYAEYQKRVSRLLPWFPRRS